MIYATPAVAATTNSFALRAERAFAEAQQDVSRKPADIDALLRLARAAFDWAEFARKDDQRAQIATTGIEAAQAIIAKSSTNAAAHYWLGMNLGQLARTKSLGALKLVREMEEAFLRARALDEHVDFAGPDRSLGLLYRDAPGWPTSIGSNKKAREHLERAVALHPEFPDNQLALLESLQKWGDRNGLQRQLKAAEKFLADARTKFTGAEWEVSWADWEQRLAKLHAKRAEPSKPVITKGAR